MFEVVFIGELGVGVELFNDPDVASMFANRMAAQGFDVTITSIATSR